MKDQEKNIESLLVKEFLSNSDIKLIQNFSS